jgi:hypothetical protein
MRSAILFVCCCGGLFAQQASIEGTAVNAVTREPLSDVHVRLVALTFNGITSAYGAISDRAGHFSIATIRPGTYVPVPERSGFLFVHSKSAEAALPNIALKPGEHRTDWIVEMSPRAILSGRVLDENGDPVQGVQVRTVDVAPDKAPMVLVPIPNVGTDDRGEFRIVGAPGKFYLQVQYQGRPSNDRPEIRGDGSSEPVYGTTFYPAALVKERGTVVEAVAGKETGGLEIRLQRQRGGMTITGTVSGLPENTEGARPMVMMQTGENAQRITGSRNSGVGADGKFSFPAVQSGFYRLYATFQTGKTQMASRAVELQIENGDPPGVELRLIPGIDLAGTLVMEGDPPGKPMDKRSVRLEASGPGAGWAMRQSAGDVDRDGAFHIENVAPAKFRVRVDSLPENAFVKTVDVDGNVSTDDTVDFSTIRPSRIKVTVSRNGAQIAGMVLDEKGERMLTPLAMVMLVQDPKDVQSLVQDSTQRVPPDGKYSFKGVRPGKYRLLAVDAFRLAGNDDSMETIRKLVERGEEIELKEGDRIAKDVRTLPKEDANAKPRQ